MILLFNLFFLFLGFFCLYFGARYLIIGIENISSRLGVSQLLMGLTILAIATSAPEIAVSIMGGLDKLILGSHIDGIVLGNKIGSFIANITLILGILGLFGGVYISKWELRREGTMLFISLFIFLIFGIDGTFTRLEGLIMMSLYFMYLFYIVRSEKKIERAKLALKNLEKERLGLQSFEPVERVSETSSLKKDIAFFIRANYFINWGRIEKISYGFELTDVIHPIKEGDRN